MKTPSFWYAPDGLLSKAMAPLGNAYALAGKIRRALAGKPYAASVPLICVGNVVAGGAGKTPVALALADLLSRRGARPAFVSRGYGGSISAPTLVDVSRHGATDVGDEALLLAAKAPCWIGRDRAATVRAAEAAAPTHIIMDDGLQNPYVAPSLSLLVVDGGVGFGNERMIPAGPLREPVAEALRRIDAIVVVETGNEPVETSVSFDRLRKRSRDQAFPELVEGNRASDNPSRALPVFRARLVPQIPPDFPSDKQFLAFAGIGRPEKFYALCRKAGLQIKETRDFADHHPFTEDETAALLSRASSQNLRLITTAKDAVRLPPALRPQILILPVVAAFDDEKAIYNCLSGVLRSAE